MAGLNIISMSWTIGIVLLLIFYILIRITVETTKTQYKSLGEDYDTK